MYAIAFDMDTAKLKANYHNTSFNNAYKEIAAILEGHGFGRQQGSVYFGDETVNAVMTVMAIMDVAAKCPWFASSVNDVRMLRIEDNNDLMPAVLRADKTRSAGKGTSQHSGATGQPDART